MKAAKIFATLFFSSLVFSCVVQAQSPENEVSPGSLQNERTEPNLDDVHHFARLIAGESYAPGSEFYDFVYTAGVGLLRAMNRMERAEVQAVMEEAATDRGKEAMKEILTKLNENLPTFVSNEDLVDKQAKLEAAKKVLDQFGKLVQDTKISDTAKKALEKMVQVLHEKINEYGVTEELEELLVPYIEQRVKSQNEETQAKQLFEYFASLTPEIPSSSGFYDFINSLAVGFSLGMNKMEPAEIQALMDEVATDGGKKAMKEMLTELNNELSTIVTIPDTEDEYAKFKIVEQVVEQVGKLFEKSGFSGSAKKKFGKMIHGIREQMNEGKAALKMDTDDIEEMRAVVAELKRVSDLERQSDAGREALEEKADRGTEEAGNTGAAASLRM